MSKIRYVKTGPLALRPVAGKSGLLYSATDNKEVYQYFGGVWSVVGSILPSYATAPSGAVNGQKYYDTVSNKERTFLNGQWRDNIASRLPWSFTGNAGGATYTISDDNSGNVSFDGAYGWYFKNQLIVNAPFSASQGVTLPNGQALKGNSHIIFQKNTDNLIPSQSAFVWNDYNTEVMRLSTAGLLTVPGGASFGSPVVPVNSADPGGVNGQIAYNSNYLFIKVGGSWLRAALAAF